MISLIHPSRGRPEKAVSTIHKWVTMAFDNFQYILSLDDGDSSNYEASIISKTADGKYIRTIRSNNNSAVDAINNAAKISEGNIMIVVSDDTDCPPHWDQKILRAMEGKSDFIIKTQDGIQPWIITNPIMDRDYYNRFGYIYHPDYLHMFCDTELTCVADITGRKITSNLLFKHNHYSVTKEAPDAINKKADATWDQGEKLFLERYKRNFDLPPGKPIQDNGMINWLKRKVR